MHFFNVLTRIQSLRDLCIISPRQLPVQSFLHDAGFLRRLVGLLLALHAFVPLPSSLFPQPITFSPLPTTPYIKTSDLAVVLDIYSRMVVGWAMESHRDEALVEQAARMALARRHRCRQG